MTLSADFLNRRCLALVAAFLILSGCAGVNNTILTNPSGQKHLTIVVFPVENKSAVKAPLREIQQSIVKRLQSRGIAILDEKAVNRTLDKHRVRYLGGLDASVSKALQEEAGADAVLITSLELYNEQPPPRIALLSRLVSTGPRPEILWSDSVGLAGDDAPGLLGLGLINDPMALSEKAVGVLTGSLAAFFSGKKTELEGGRKSYAPKIKFRSSSVGVDLLENEVNFVDRTSSGDERKGRARIAVVLTSPSKAPVTVEYAAGSGTAAMGKDYELRGNALIFAPGETKKEIEIEVKYNAVYKDNKTVDLILESVKGAALGSTTMHTYTIVNTVPLPTASFASASLQVKKTEGPAGMLVELSAISGKDVMVPFTVSGTAKTPLHYTITPSPLTIKAGIRSAAIMITASDSGMNDDDKTVAVHLGVPVHATQGEITTSTVTLVNTTPEPAVTFTTAMQQVKETAGTVTIGIELSAVSGRDVVVPYLVEGTARTPGNYTMAAGPVVIKAGTRSAAITVNVSDNGINEDDKTVVVSMGMPTNAIQGKITTSAVTIVDADPAPKVSFRNGSSSGEETTSPVRLEVSLSSVSGKPVSVEYGVKGGTAVKGKDYAFLQADTLFFAPGETRKEIVVDIKGHGIYDDDKTFVVALKNPKNAVLGDTIAHTYTIIVSGEAEQSTGTTTGGSNRPLLLAMAGTPGPLVLPNQIGTRKGDRKGVPLPSIGFLYASSRGDEKVAAVRIPVGLSTASGKPVTVEYAVTGGTAEEGKQYVLKGSSITFAPGETLKEIELLVKDDGMNREDRTVEVRLSKPQGAELGRTTVHTYTILNTTPEPAVTFTTAMQQVKETAGTVTIGIELSAVSGRDVVVPYLVEGTARTPGNYTMAAGPVVIKAGTRSAAITVNVSDNGINEDDKTVVVSMGMPTNAIQGKITTSAVTIVDADPAPKVSFRNGSSSGEETTSPVRLEVSLSSVSGKPVSVEYGVKGGTAVKGKDYAFLQADTLFFAPGETRKEIVVDIKGHGIYDDDKTFVVALKNPKNAVLGDTIAHTYTIKNIAALPSIAFLQSSSRGDEKSTTIRIPVGLSAASGKPVTVEYETMGKDHTFFGGILIFDPQETTKDLVIDIRNMTSDKTNKKNKNFEAMLKNPKNAVLGEAIIHTYASFQSTEIGTGTASNQKIKNAATLSAATAVEPSAESNVDGIPPEVSFGSAHSQGKETASPVRLAVGLSTASGKPVTVEYAVTGGTAEEGKQYVLKGSSITFAPGETLKEIELLVKDDGMNREDRTVEVRLSKPQGAELGRTTVHTYTILNATPEPAVTFTTAMQQVKETAGTVTIGIELSAVSGRDVVVPYLVEGTARTPGNYTMAAGPVVIKAGTRSAAITVNVSDNGINEDDKTVVVSMGMPTNAIQGKITTSAVTIVDADPAPKVSFRNGSSSGEETTSPVRLEVSLSSVSGKPVSVEYGVKGGTAVKGKDYAFLQADTLFFAPGETRKEIVVDIKGHGIYDDDKTFVVALKNPKNAVLGDTIAHTYTIIVSGEAEQSTGTTTGGSNRPLLLAMAGTPGPLVLPNQIGTRKGDRKGVPLPLIGFLYASSRGDEKVAAVRIPVGLSTASGKPVTVEYAVTGGTAVWGVNFTLKDGMLTFKPGETIKTIEITVRDNNVNEEDKTLEVRLKNPRGAVPGTMTVFTYTIIDSDPPPAVSFSTSGQQVKETAGAVIIGAELSAVSGRDVTVPFMASGTAVSPLNYTITPAPLVIKAGRRSAAITVNVLHNGINEDDKTVVVCMGIPTNAVQGKTTMSTVTIINTDPPPTVSFTTEGQQVKEGAGPVFIGAELSAVSGRDVTVPFMVSGMPAVQSNYSITPGPLVIKAGTRSAAITVTTSDNGVNEGDKTVVMTMGIPVNATQGKIRTSTITIVDADPAPTVSFTQKGSSGDERASPARLEVGLSAASGRTVQVEFAVTGGTAAKGKDYALPGNTLTFEPGETKKAIEIGIGNSGVYGDNKTLEVALTKSINGGLGIITKHTFTILNTSPKPVVTFTIANQRFKRNIGRVIVQVRLSAVSGKDVIVPFTISGSAVQGKDYAVTASPVAVPAGERNAVIAIELKEGLPSEADKRIELKLGNPDNALLGSPNYYRLVLVKDARPTIAVLPFFNISKKNDAGDILMLQFVKELRKLTDFTVIEPGMVREQLLNMRVIMYEGISSSDIDLITDSVNADLIVTGKVFDYKDFEASWGKPRVNFTVMLISKTSKRVIWSSSSVNSGDDSLILFSWGEVNTANAMVSEMIEAVRKTMLSW